MREARILMKNFELKTYESQGDFPEIEVHASFIFPACGKQITHIDAEALKRKLTELLYYQAVKVEPPSATAL
ncbi:MAG: hypothetical protein IKL01_08345 [Mailhella sp.]|nr:hypothetical protein [Mailhella sp.]